MVEIKQADGRVVARHIPGGEAWGDGLRFFSQDPDFIQVGTWGYSAGKDLLAHKHNTFDRTINLTQEVLYIRKGSVRADVYDMEDKKVAEVEASEGDILVLLHGGHGYRILQDDTQVLEIKNGPYAGADRDRTRL